MDGLRKVPPAPLHVEVKLTKASAASDDWTHEIYLNGQRMGHGFTELPALGHVIEMLLMSSVKGYCPHSSRPKTSKARKEVHA